MNYVAGDVLPWKDRVCRSVLLIESQRDATLEEATLIGHVARQTKEAKWHIRLKSVQFSWQRGVKIGKLLISYPLKHDSTFLVLVRLCIIISKWVSHLGL